MKLCNGKNLWSNKIKKKKKKNFKNTFRTVMTNSKKDKKRMIDGINTTKILITTSLIKWKIMKINF